jgi:hypothetical protein
MMTTIPMTSKHVLQFCGLDPQVMSQLQAPRMQAEAHSLFQETLEVLMNQDAKHGASIKMVSQTPDSKASMYFSGMIRHLNRTITGYDIQPQKQKIHLPPTKLTQQYSDMFSRSKESTN